VKDILLAEVEQLKLSYASDLERVLEGSKIRYYPNPAAPARKSNKYSIHFAPQNDDDRDAFIDLLTDELLLRALSPTGELEDLWQRLLEEIALQDKLRRRYGDTLITYSIVILLMPE
jgi:hypothetical protein